MASDTSTHAFPDQECSCVAILLARFDKYFAMNGNELGQLIRTLSTFARVVVIEGLDVSYLGQTFLALLHLRIRGRRARAETTSEQRLPSCLNAMDAALRRPVSAACRR